MRKTIESEWILLDNHPTEDVLIKPRMVQNIHHPGGRYIKTHCNVGKCRVTKESTLKGYGTVWFDEGAITNILYLSSIREKYPIYYDTEGNYFSVVKPDKEVLLRNLPSGIYFQDTSN